MPATEQGLPPPPRLGTRSGLWGRRLSRRREVRVLAGLVLVAGVQEFDVELRRVRAVARSWARSGGGRRARGSARRLRGVGAPHVRAGEHHSEDARVPPALRALRRRATCSGSTLSMRAVTDCGWARPGLASPARSPSARRSSPAGRLRRSGVPSARRAEAVLSRDGALVHAEGGARDEDARAELRRERARVQPRPIARRSPGRRHHAPPLSPLILSRCRSSTSSKRAIVATSSRSTTARPRS